jgi:MFS family permease
MSGGSTNSRKWLVPVGSMLALMVGNGAVFTYSFGVFLKPLTEATGWARGTVSLGQTFGLILGGLATPIYGLLIDRFGVQRVTLVAITLFTACFAAMSLTPSNVAVFIAMYAVTGIFAAGHAPLPFAKAISGWFEDRRGLALGIAMAGVGIGIAIMPHLLRFLFGAVGWQQTYVYLGVIAWLVAFPSVLFLVKDPPIDITTRANAVQPLAPDSAFPGYGKEFWLIAVSIFLVVTAINGTTGHMVALLTDRGLSGEFAAGMLSAVGLSTIVGRLLSGYLLDRIFAPYIAAVTFLIPLIGIGLLLAGVMTPVYIMAGAICFGLGLGAEVDIIGFLVGRYFGLRRYGEVYGYIFVGFTAGSGIGPALMGASFDKTGSYNTTLMGFAIALVLASILILFLGPYRYAARHHEPSEITPSPLAASTN